MTRTRQKCTLLIAAFVLAIGCAIAASTPQTAYAVKDLGVGVGTTSATATNVPLKGKSLSMTYDATFKYTNDNNFYKFKTSNRNSSYRISLKALSTDGTIYFTVYDSGMHRFFQSEITTAKKRTIELQKLKRNQTYYIEVWRFAVDSPQYIQDNDSNIQYAEYRLSVKEIITPPNRVTGAKMSRAGKYKVRIQFNESRYASGYQVRWDRTWWKTTKNKRGTWDMHKDTNHVFTTKYHGKKHPYRFSVRPYRIVNGKKYYGGWRACVLKGTDNTKTITLK